MKKYYLESRSRGISYIGTISQQAAVHPWLAADVHVNKQYPT
jgi:hypothetical protein